MKNIEPYFVARTLIAALAIVFCFSSGICAENDTETDELSDISLGEILNLDVDLISATGTVKTIRQAPAVASVITAEDIERTGARTLQEALEMVPGLHFVGMNQNGGTGLTLATYAMRGILTTKNPHVLMLINSIPATSPTNGDRMIKAMPVENISRIEVIRGPGSAVYGADAFAGTINIITKNAKEIDGTRFGVRGGSFDTYDAWGQYGDTLNRWDVALSLEYVGTDGDSGRILDSDTQTNFDSMFGTQASYAPGSLDTGGEVLTAQVELAKDRWTLRSLGYWNNSSFGAGSTNALGLRDAEQKAYLASITYQNNEFADHWNVIVNTSYLQDDYDFLIELFPPGAILPIGSDGNLFTPGGGMVLFPEGVWGAPGRTEQSANAECTALFSGFEHHFIRMGAGFKYQDVEARAEGNFGAGVLDGTEDTVARDMTSTTGTEYLYMSNSTRHVWFLYLQDEWRFARKWELTAGVRYDRYSDFGNTVNPRLALVWNTSRALTMKLLYGTAFRPPAFAELYSKNNPQSLGNPDLDPETIRTLELAFDYLPVSRVHTSFNLFGYKIKNLIDKIRDPDTGEGHYHNVRDQDGWGFEVEAKAGITEHLSVTGNFSYQHSQDADTDETVPNAPGMQAYLNAHWMFLPDWSVDAYLHWVGDRHRAGGDSRPEIDDYATVNLSLRRKHVFRHWDFALGARNLFDEDVREPAPLVITNDYPLEGRSFFGEVRCHF